MKENFPYFVTLCRITSRINADNIYTSKLKSKTFLSQKIVWVFTLYELCHLIVLLFFVIGLNIHCKSIEPCVKAGFHFSEFGRVNRYDRML